MTIRGAGPRPQNQLKYLFFIGLPGGVGGGAAEKCELLKAR